jgi:hypothetical protein
MGMRSPASVMVSLFRNLRRGVAFLTLNAVEQDIHFSAEQLSRGRGVPRQPFQFPRTGVGMPIELDLSASQTNGC